MTEFKRIGNKLIVDGGRLMFRNFEGRESRYNDKGKRNFCVAIEDAAIAQEMAKEGWNVRILAPRDASDTPLHYIQVEARFDNIPPEIYIVKGRNRKTRLDESMVKLLDNAEIVKADIVINARYWDDKGVERIKAYLKEMYVTIEESPFAERYAEEEYPEE